MQLEIFALIKSKKGPIPVINYIQVDSDYRSVHQPSREFTRGRSMAGEGKSLGKVKIALYSEPAAGCAEENCGI